MNKPKERPIIFDVQEVNAVLVGDKTQYRVPFDFEFKINTASLNETADDIGWSVQKLITRAYHEAVYDFECPFGAIGDRLWVQEDWRVGAWREIGGVLAIDYKASPEITNTPWVQVSDDEDGKKFQTVWIAVTDELDSKGVKTNDDGHYHWPAGQAPLDWRDASTMERWASRLLLQITDIRIERIQDISEQDAISQGIKHIHADPKDRVGPNHFTKSNGWYHCSRPTAAEVFKEMYKVSDDYDKYGENPWVWVIEFKIIEPSEVQGG